jgi:hypothetical protein
VNFETTPFSMLDDQKRNQESNSRRSFFLLRLATPFANCSYLIFVVVTSDTDWGSPQQGDPAQVPASLDFYGG